MLNQQDFDALKVKLRERQIENDRILFAELARQNRLPEIVTDPQARSDTKLRMLDGGVR